MIPYTVERCDRHKVEQFIEKWHYSGSINGVRDSYCFRLMDGRTIVGAMLFGTPAMHNQWKPYADREDDVIELRRLCCIDDTPKNTESWFISRCIKWLRDYTNIKVILSYADETHNHTGIIYKASNFKYHGMTAPGKMIRYKGQLYHDKTIRTKYKGKLKPFAQEILNALDNGTAEWVDTKGKHIYTYEIRRKFKVKEQTSIEKW